MNRTEWVVSHLALSPVAWVNQETSRPLPSQDLFRLHLSSSGGEGGWHSDIVHIPKALQAHFLQDDVTSFSVEILPIGRLGSRLLPGDPGALVRAVTTRAGLRITVIPPRITSSPSISDTWRPGPLYSLRAIDCLSLQSRYRCTQSGRRRAFFSGYARYSCGLTATNLTNIAPFLRSYLCSSCGESLFAIGLDIDGKTDELRTETTPQPGKNVCAAPQHLNRNLIDAYP